MENGTLGGQGPSPLNYWCIPSPLSLMLVAISSSTETTQGLSRVGGDITTATEQSMMSSEGFTSSLTIYPDISRLLPLISQVCSIQQMTHPEASLAQMNFFSLPLIFPQNLTSSSSMQQSLSSLPNSIICTTGLTPLPLASSSIESLSNNKQQSGPELPELRKKVSSGQPSKMNNSSRVSHFPFWGPNNVHHDLPIYHPQKLQTSPNTLPVITPSPLLSKR